MRHLLLATVLALSAALAAPATSSAAQLLVGFDPGASNAARTAALRAAGATGSAELPRLDARVVRVADAAAPALRRTLARQGAVRYVETDAVARIAWTPNDPHFGSQWALAKVGATSAWNTSLGASVVIADLDTGVDYRHPDLAGKVTLGPDYVANDSDPADENGHGTHVAGIAAAVTNNGTGIAGMAPSARILAVRVLDANGSGYHSNIAQGITYATDHGAKVINLSLGGSSGSTTLLNAVNYAASKGAIVTCAAGNDSASTIGYPARYDACTSIAASTSTDARASYSNWGTGLDLTAPGSSILSTVRGGGYQSWSGTSMATPMASGLAALLFAQGLDRAAVLSRMTSTAKDVGAAGYDTGFGFGRIDAAAALAAPAPAPEPAPEPSPEPTPTPTPEPTPTTNQAPACSNLAISVRRKTSQTIALRCTDADGDTLTYALTRQPRYGTLSNFNATTGTVTYTPRWYFRGSDSFTYTAADATTTATSATVSVTVS